MAGDRAAILVLAFVLRLVGACPEGWTRFETFCLRVFEGPATWDEAKVSCENRGARLASIHSQAENDQHIFACGNVRPYNQGCWLGGTDRHQRNRQWIWVDGTKFDWTRWFDHGSGNVEPNNDYCTDHRYCTFGHTADCNVLEVSKPFRGHWLDTFCTDRQKFICKVNDTALSESLNQETEVVPLKRSRLPSPPPPPPPPPAPPAPPTPTPPPTPSPMPPTPSPTPLQQLSPEVTPSTPKPSSLPSDSAEILSAPVDRETPALKSTETETDEEEGSSESDIAPQAPAAIETGLGEPAETEDDLADDIYQ
eukprot:symbB.v1.2.028440.t1/scaffold3016.1/size65323/5